jgi:hypothetical protein
VILADLEAIKRRCEAATPGPWESTGYDDHPGDEGWWINSPQPGGAIAVTPSYNRRGEADHEFIRHARSDVPALLEAVERLLSMLTDAQTEAEMQAARAGRLLVCAEWARLHIDIEWPDGPTGDTDNWRRFVAVLDRDAGPLPGLWAK